MQLEYCISMDLRRNLLHGRKACPLSHLAGDEFRLTKLRDPLKHERIKKSGPSQQWHCLGPRARLFDVHLPLFGAIRRASHRVFRRFSPFTPSPPPLSGEGPRTFPCLRRQMFPTSKLSPFFWFTQQL